MLFFQPKSNLLRRKIRPSSFTGMKDTQTSPFGSKRRSVLLRLLKKPPKRFCRAILFFVQRKVFFRQQQDQPPSANSRIASQLPSLLPSWKLFPRWLMILLRSPHNQSKTANPDSVFSMRLPYGVCSRYANIRTKRECPGHFFEYQTEIFLKTNFFIRCNFFLF